MKGNRNNRDCRKNLKEMLEANPKENDSMELGDSWKGMPRRTEVLANRSHNLYPRHRDAQENVYNVIMVKRSTQEAAIDSKINAATTENYAGFVPSSSTQDSIVTEEINPKAFDATPALSFTDFIRSNNRTNIQVTSTPYGATTANLIQSQKNCETQPKAAPRTPKQSVPRTSFHINRNDESFVTPRSSRVPVNLMNNNQAARESGRVDVIPDNNECRLQTGSAIVSSTVHLRDNILTSDDDCEAQPVFLKPPEMTQFRNPQIVPTSFKNNVSNQKRNQGEGQLSKDPSINFTQNAKQKGETHREVGVSAKEYMELMQTRTSNTQPSESSTASSTRRKLYKKGDSIEKSGEINPNIIANQKDSDNMFDHFRSDQICVTNQVKEISFPTRSEKIVSRTSRPLQQKLSTEDHQADGETDKLQNDEIIQPNYQRKATMSPRICLSKWLCSEIRDVNIEEQTNDVGKKPPSDELRKQSTHSNTPINSEQNGSKTKQTKVITQPNYRVEKSKFSKKSAKRALLSKQSNVHSEKNSSTLVEIQLSTQTVVSSSSKNSRRQPSSIAPDNNEDDFLSTEIQQAVGESYIEHFTENTSKNPSSSNGLNVESDEDTFETSDIQPSNEADTNKNKSQKRPVLLKPALHNEQNDNEAISVGQSRREIGRKQLSKKSKKCATFSKQKPTQIAPKSSKLFANKTKTENGEQILSKKSRKRPSPVDNEQESMVVDNIEDIEQLSDEYRKRQNNVETEENSFETSVIQPRKKVGEDENKSRKNQRRAKKQPVQVDGPPPKRSRRNARSNEKRADTEEGDVNQATNESNEHQFLKPKTKNAPKKKRTLDVIYDAMKDRDIIPGTRHSARTRRLPEIPPTTIPKHYNAARSISSNIQAVRIPPKTKKRSHKTGECIVSMVLDGEIPPFETSVFHDTQISNGCKTVFSDDATVNYVPSFEQGRICGWMTLPSNSSKTGSRTTTDLWMMVMSGSTDLVINDEYRKLTTGSVVFMGADTIYDLKNNNEDKTLIFFSQRTDSTT